MGDRSQHRAFGVLFFVIALVAAITLNACHMVEDSYRVVQAKKAAEAILAH